jgi:hypothetical protein
LCESLAKVKGTDDWDLHIPAVLLAYRTKKHATTGYTPFQLIYGRQAILSIETLIPIEPIEETEFDLEDSILTRAYELIEKLLKLQNDALEKTIESQQKQKQRFDKKIREETFKIREKV